MMVNENAKKFFVYCCFIRWLSSAFGGALDLQFISGRFDCWSGMS